MERIDRRKISQLISTLRKSNDLSANEMGKLLGVSERTIRRWEKGESLPSMDDVVNIVNTFGITIEDVYCGERALRKRKESVLNPQPLICPLKNRNLVKACYQPAVLLKNPLNTENLSEGCKLETSFVSFQ